MPFSSSQEKTIYDRLAGQIQLGFYDDGERFPSAQDIARQFQVSYCPAQRALKALERDGLISLCRGKETVVLKKPYKDYLQSPVFRERAAALADLSESLALISPGIGFLGMCCTVPAPLTVPLPAKNDSTASWKTLYTLFRAGLDALGNNTIKSLYYDVGDFIGSAYMDLLHSCSDPAQGEAWLYHFINKCVESLAACRNGEYVTAMEGLKKLNDEFFGKVGGGLKKFISEQHQTEQVAYQWAPRKGRKQYCDPIAINLLCKIYQGIYPKGAFLPKNSVLAKEYHVSEITLRRTLALLNKAGITETTNGVGTRVIFTEKKDVATLLKTVMLEDNLLIFLESLQLLAVTCGPVFSYTFPYLSEDALRAISDALCAQTVNSSAVAAVNICMQEISRCCPLAAVREIYTKLTLLLLNGNALQLDQPVINAEAGWSAFTREVAGAIMKKDGRLFAFAFRRLVVNIFYDMREYLLRAGITGVERVIAPSIRQSTFEGPPADSQY